MRIIFIFIVSIQFISGGSVGVQLSKMGYFLAHLQKYQLIEKGSVVDFITLHYGNTGHTESSQDHSRLPFHQVGTDFTYALMLHQTEAVFKLSGTAVRLNKKAAGQQNCYSNKHIASLFKPPI
jgi:hypothetical protein